MLPVSFPVSHLAYDSSVPTPPTLGELCAVFKVSAHFPNLFRSSQRLAAILAVRGLGWWFSHLTHGTRFLPHSLLFYVQLALGRGMEYKCFYSTIFKWKSFTLSTADKVRCPLGVPSSTKIVENFLSPYIFYFNQQIFLFGNLRNYRDL